MRIYNKSSEASQEMVFKWNRIRIALTVTRIVAFVFHLQAFPVTLYTRASQSKCENFARFHCVSHSKGNVNPKRSATVATLNSSARAFTNRYLSSCTGVSTVCLQLVNKFKAPSFKLFKHSSNSNSSSSSSSGSGSGSGSSSSSSNNSGSSSSSSSSTLHY